MLEHLILGSDERKAIYRQERKKQSDGYALVPIYARLTLGESIDKGSGLIRDGRILLVPKPSGEGSIEG